MTKRELIDLCLKLPQSYEDYPFDGGDAHSDDGTWTMLRHCVNKKGFAHVYERNNKLCINLKCDPMEADFMRQTFADIVPGWHMNHNHWNTIYVNGSVPLEELRRQIENSYDLVKPKVRKKKI